MTVAVPLVTMASMVAAFVEIKLLNLSFLSATLAAAEPLSVSVVHLHSNGFQMDPHLKLLQKVP